MAYDLNALREQGPPILMEMLLQAVSERATVEYKKVAFEIQRRTTLGRIFSVHVGQVAGTLMDRIIDEMGDDIPPINAIVVRSGKAGLPGKGVSDYLNQFGGQALQYVDMTTKQKRQFLVPIFERVYRYQSWREVAQRVFGLKVLPSERVIQTGKEDDGKARRAGFGGPAESPEHLALKNFVAENPAKFGAPPDVRKGFTEYLLKSGDEVDVCFEGADEIVLVEVKSRRSVEDDLRRGVYQCVKYRAVKRATEKIEGAERKIRVQLVTENPLSKETVRIAENLAVKARCCRDLIEKG